MKNKELEKGFIDEKTWIKYIRQGDYYIPKITIPRVRITRNIGKYERLKLNYMKKYKISEYTEMLLSNELKKLFTRYRVRLYIYKIQRSRICDLWKWSR